MMEYAYHGDIVLDMMGNVGVIFRCILSSKATLCGVMAVFFA